MHGGGVGAAFGELGQVPGMGPEDGHAPSAKSNSGRGQEWGGSWAEEPGLKSLPSGLPVPPPGQSHPRGMVVRRVQPCQHPALGRGIPSSSLLPGLPCLQRPCCQHQQGTEDTCPAQCTDNTPSGWGSLTRLNQLRRYAKGPCGHIRVSTTSLTFFPRPLLPQHLQQAPATSRPQERVLCQALSHPLGQSAVRCPVPPRRHVDRCHLLSPPRAPTLTMDDAEPRHTPVAPPAPRAGPAAPQPPGAAGAGACPGRSQGLDVGRLRVTHTLQGPALPLLPSPGRQQAGRQEGRGAATL